MADVIAICLVADVKPLLKHELADVIAKWQVLKPLQGGSVVADVIASGRWKNHKVNYFNFRSEVLNRTSSQTCGRWYLPTFLLRDGSLTLMYRASFIVLIFSSLSHLLITFSSSHQLSIENILSLLEFCITSTYFSF